MSPASTQRTGSLTNRYSDTLMTHPTLTVGLSGIVNAVHDALRAALDYFQTLDLGEFTGLGDTVYGEGRSRKREGR